jgi:hypothetical protein
MGWLDAAIDIGKNALSKNAGSIAAGVAGAVLGSGKGKGAGGQTTSITSVPAWMSDYAQQLMTQANAAASRPYEQYAGPRVAGLTQDQQDAANLVRGNTGQVAGVLQNAMGQIDPNAGQGMLQQAGQYLSDANTNWLDNSGRYMDDYTSHVINPAIAQGNRNWNEVTAPTIAGTFAGNRGVGGYGSSAMLKNMTAAGSRLNEVLGENTASYLDRGYTGGMSQYNADRSQKGQLASIAQGLGQTAQGMNLNDVNALSGLARQWGDSNATDVNALNAVGAQEQGVNQAGMDVDYNNWLASQGYDKSQIAYLQSILNGSPGVVPKTTTGTTSSTQYTSPLQAATQGYALYNAMTQNKAPPPTTAPGNMPGVNYDYVPKQVPTDWNTPVQP